MRDQNAKHDAGKPRISLVPTEIIRNIAVIREYGCEKYKDPDNWKTVETERYRDALGRHVLAYYDDPYGVDEESGLPHLWHAACNLAFLCEMEKDEMMARVRPCKDCTKRTAECHATCEEYKRDAEESHRRKERFKKERGGALDADIFRKDAYWEKRRRSR